MRCIETTELLDHCGPALMGDALSLV